MIPGLAQWVKVLVLPVAVLEGLSCSSDLTWMWVWPPSAALIGPLARELPYAPGVALKNKAKQKKQQQKKKKKRKRKGMKERKEEKGRREGARK